MNVLENYFGVPIKAVAVSAQSVVDSDSAEKFVLVNSIPACTITVLGSIIVSGWINKTF
jgi:hypothetical protein